MENKNYLNTQAYTEMASEVSDVIEDLRLIKHTLGFVKPPREITEANQFQTEYFKIYQYLDTAFNKVQGLIADLEHISGALYSVDELEELKGFVKDEWLLLEEKEQHQNMYKK